MPTDLQIAVQGASAVHSSEGKKRMLCEIRNMGAEAMIEATGRKQLKKGAETPAAASPVVYGHCFGLDHHHADFRFYCRGM